MMSKFDFRKFSASKIGSDTEEIPDTHFISTGCYALNALLSADVFGGIASNRVTAFAGESGTGKSYLIQSIMAEFLNQDGEDVGSYLFETEFAADKAGFLRRDINEEQVVLRYPRSIEVFKLEMSNILDKLGDIKEKDRPKILFVLDSLGNLPSEKEWTDAKDKEKMGVNDMTRQKQLRSAFRVLTLDLGKLGYPMLVANHTYQNIGGYGDPNTISGGGGLIYAASSIVSLSKAKDVDVKTKVQTGLILTARTFKSRHSKTGQTVKLSLDFDKGLDPFYGLTQIALDGGLFTMQGKKILLPDGTAHFESWIDKNAPKIWDKENLSRINEIVKERYALGSGDKVIDETNLEEDETE